MWVQLPKMIQAPEINALDKWTLNPEPPYSQLPSPVLSGFPLDAGHPPLTHWPPVMGKRQGQWEQSPKVAGPLGTLGVLGSHSRRKEGLAASGHLGHSGFWLDLSLDTWTVWKH